MEMCSITTWMERRIKFHRARLHIFQIVRSTDKKSIKLIPEYIYITVRNFILSHDAFPIVLKNTACPGYAVHRVLHRAGRRIEKFP